MKTVTDVFDVWPTYVDMATDVDVPHERCRKWGQRGSIPRSAWDDVIRGARKRGVKLSVEQLHAMHKPTVGPRLAVSSRACQ